ncbi:MAG: hypothetical protein KAG66_18840, partial [Methylococcales bacterium]|nr:hypothetical protein [Methylococcales bacterium]
MTDLLEIPVSTIVPLKITDCAKTRTTVLVGLRIAPAIESLRVSSALSLGADATPHLQRFITFVSGISRTEGQQVDTLNDPLAWDSLLGSNVYKAHLISLLSLHLKAPPPRDNYLKANAVSVGLWQANRDIRLWRDEEDTTLSAAFEGVMRFEPPEADSEQDSEEDKTLTLDFVFEDITPILRILNCLKAWATPTSGLPLALLPAMCQELNLRIVDTLPLLTLMYSNYFSI